MKSEGSSCRVCSAMSSFFLGGVIGAAVALLVAPRAGKETRQQIKGAAEGVKGKAHGPEPFLPKATLSSKPFSMPLVLPPQQVPAPSPAVSSQEEVAARVEKPFPA